jgi:hypothetical protein
MAVQAARDDARLILERAADLSGTLGQALRIPLYLFERGAAVHHLTLGLAHMAARIGDRLCGSGRGGLDEDTPSPSRIF